MTKRRLLCLAITVALVFSMSVSAFAGTTWTDAHGNAIELGDNEAASNVVLDGADNKARMGETNLGDMWTDAMRWFVTSGKINDCFNEDDVTAEKNKIFVDNDHVVALWNGGNLRADIPADKFDELKIAEVLPYPNKVAIIYMTGAQLEEALEAAAYGIPYTEETADAAASFMQVSGLKYQINTAEAYDQGEAYGKFWFKANSVKRVKITEVNGKKFDKDACYAVITSNANFNGMDSSYMFKEAAAANENSTITNAVVRDTVWAYINEELENVITAEKYGTVQDRITILTAKDIAVQKAVKASQPELSAVLSNGAVKLTIKNNSGYKYDYYEVYRSTSKDKISPSVKVNPYKAQHAYAAKTTTYKNTKVTKGKTYYYKVRGVRTVAGQKVYSKYSKYVSRKVA